MAESGRSEGIRRPTVVLLIGKTRLLVVFPPRIVGACDRALGSRRAGRWWACQASCSSCQRSATMPHRIVEPTA